MTRQRGLHFFFFMVVLFTTTMTARSCAAEQTTALIIPPERHASPQPSESSEHAQFSLREQVLYASRPEPATGNIRFDEWAFTGKGALGPRFDFRLEHYLLEGAQAGLTREAWVRYQIISNAARIPMTVRAGEFTLPLPLDPKDDLQSSTPFAVWDQAVGANPFTFFDSKIGTEVEIGRREHGINAALAVLEGHERQSAYPARSADTAASLRYRMEPITATLYRYEGRRVVGNMRGGFSRTGLGVVWERGLFQFAAVGQLGRDGDADGSGTNVSSSGGFVQGRYAWGRRPFVLARWDTVADDIAGSSHRLVALAGWIFGDNLAMSLEDRVVPGPAGERNTVLAQLIVGR
jgi:hypothetical protein